MGKTGRKLGEALGRGLGFFAGKHLGKHTGIGADEGGKIGSDIAGDFLEKLIPFKKGGRIKKNMAIYAHKGEFILPKGVRPTKTQLKAVKKRGGKL